MSLRTQSKLLRVLEERSFERVGGSRTIHVDVRLVAATNKNLLEEVERGRFREDLYYRLKVADLPLPPLRERPSDIAPLADRFLTAALKRCGRDSAGFTDEALQLLEAAPWRGNVRELKNAVEYAAVMSDGGAVGPELLPSDLRDDRTSTGAAPGAGASGRLAELVSLPFADARREAIERFEREYVENRLRAAGGNVSEAARDMGIARQSLQAKLKDLRIDAGRFRLKSPDELNS